MNHLDYSLETKGLPAPADLDLCARGHERWIEALHSTGDSDCQAFAQGTPENPSVSTLLDALFGNSPYLTQCAISNPKFILEVINQGPEWACADIQDRLTHLRSDLNADEVRVMCDLRQAKRDLSLAVAIADITNIWSVEQITHALSDFADKTLSCAASYALRKAADSGAITLAYEDDPERDSGYIILGMGKLGAGELNYSSDIDLIILFDPEVIQSEKPADLQRQFVRITRNLVKVMDERTADGYVFRTDLRLRPDPSATPIAVSVQAAEVYYESLGQNWERAAMIKARPVAGDLKAGTALIDWLTSFVWRKNLDFEAIRDIHSIKRQINAHRGGNTIALAGHNIKLGRGGIREIEFFTQTQQLIWGGRTQELRKIKTVDALATLAEHERIDPSVATEMTTSYRFLRRVEHRLQMVNDAQTHTLPADHEGLNKIAIFLGYENTEMFGEDLLRHLRNVETHYAALFEESEPLSIQGDVRGNLVFTGADTDPETLSTLENLGFENPQAVDSMVRVWHHGRYRSTHNTRARQLLTELMPVLLKSLADTANPDQAFLRFNEFLAGLPAGIQLFSMFHSNPHLLNLVAEIMGEAPKLARHLSHKPSVLDSVLDPGFFDAPPNPDELHKELEAILHQTEFVEDTLDATRRWANDRWFQIGVQSLRGHQHPQTTAEALSDIAECSVDLLNSAMAKEFTHRHGVVPGSEMVVLALGKLGGREMTSTSDLDMIFVYKAPADAKSSDGPKPLVLTQYFARLSQRVINSITAQTSEGRLFEVDMRLRPSGNAGPIASSLQAFVQYHNDLSWTWEHMAMTRARVIAGPPDLRREVESVIAEVLTRPRDGSKLLADVASMRSRMDDEHHTENPLAIKHLRGGLVDIEFISQYLQLRH
ncbi:MAG: bifunctional [glutamine synthetase] adenylyltransferase/[glutamine synthetase]-adenylyl-L-tyrosine phosphorylase, partial [Rhodospirillales bacterium]|nr:bifunctional [glutamine synthetase] adenylyltransferase/[glutamine synthetase]-adenylyl-L-tyrosine phosphorylase [Rhodospirillales bacterium]